MSSNQNTDQDTRGSAPATGLWSSHTWAPPGMDYKRAYNSRPHARILDFLELWNVEPSSTVKLNRGAAENKPSQLDLFPLLLCLDLSTRDPVKYVKRIKKSAHCEYFSRCSVQWFFSAVVHAFFFTAFCSASSKDKRKSVKMLKCVWQP